MSLVRGRTERINIQVAARLLASVRIQRIGKEVQVTIKGTPTFPVTEVDTASIRFGPEPASPLRTWIGAGDQGLQDLLLTWPRSSIGPIAGPTSVCISGQRADGVLFEGCDLIGQ
jgi:hypothetical protein